MSQTQSFGLVSAPLANMSPLSRVGRVVRMGNRVAVITGLSDVASVGHRVSLSSGGRTVPGEIVEVTETDVHAMIEQPADWLRIGDAAIHLGAFRLYPDDSWLGRIVDGDGQPLDDATLLQGCEGVSLDSAPPPATARRGMGGRVETGYAVFDTVLPIVRGQRIGLFSGSGVGKSSLMAAFARDFNADVVVIGLIGERGREVKEFVDRVLGRKGLARSVVVASTSDRSAVARRRAAFTAMAVAEHFRDQGRHVLLMMDSVTRLAEAHREIATASGEPAAMRGHPPSMTQLMSSLAERAGPGTDAQGDITAILTILVSGSDMDEPVADTFRGLLDGHVVLARAIAERGRFPAVDVLQSVSRALPYAASDQENALILEFRRILALYEGSEIMVRAGLHQPGANPDLDRAIDLFPQLDQFCAERNTAGVPEAFAYLTSLFDVTAPTPDQEPSAE